jgi:hypothetical protein
MDVVFAHVEPGDPVRISASTYVAWKKCPDQANARLQGKYTKDSRPAFLGTLAHRLFSRHLAKGPIDLADFDRVCKEEIGSSRLNNKMAGLEMKPSTLAGVIEEARDLYQRFVKYSDEGFAGAEVEISYETGDGVELVGSVDAVYREDLGGYRLVDWKTGELGQPDDQLLFYALLWTVDRGEPPARVEAVSVRTGERFETVPMASDLQHVADETTQMASDLRATWHSGSTLERRAGPWCRYCPILDECPEGQATEALLG